jgi:hypothetical protein
MKKNKKKGPCWKGYEAIGMKMKGGRKVPNCVPVSESVDRIFEELSLINEKKIKRATRVANALYKQRKKAEGTSAESAARLAHQAQLNKLQAAKKESAGRKAARVEDSIERIGCLVFESGNLDEGRFRDFYERLKDNLKSPESRRRMLGKALTGGLALVGGYQRYVAPYGKPDAQRNALDNEVPETATEKGMRNIMGDKYKDNWLVQKTREFRNKLGTRNKDQDLVWGAYDLVTPGNRQQKLQNKYGKSYPNRSVVNPYAKGYDPYASNESTQQNKQNNELNEVAAWQRKEGKNPSGGLNKKGVESYRRENPGSKLKTAVTTDPSKLKKGSKAANRRKSFCARMGGMKNSRTSAKTANDPDSRINKALRKWNC